ncbi:hypothetical protein MTO96_026381 [Rhipicephalus appendiculatus]
MLCSSWSYLVVGLVAAFGCALLQFVWKLLRINVRRNLPPGPRGLPFLGYLPFMLKDGHLEAEALKKKYGNVIGAHLGSRYVVFLCDFDSIKAALSDPAVLCRPKEFPLSNNPYESLITLNGTLWQEQHRFFLKMFKKLGAGTTAMEAVIQVLAINFFPWLRSALSYLGLGACGRLRRALERRNQFSEWAVNENEKSYVDGVVRNFTDGFLAEMKHGGEQRNTFTRKLLVGNVASYIGGGTSTTYTALQWLLLTSAAYPQLQSRVRAETDVIMKERKPGSAIMWNDHRQMPYTMAFIWETIRCKPVNPLSIMRCATDDVKGNVRARENPSPTWCCSPTSQTFCTTSTLKLQPVLCA